MFCLIKKLDAQNKINRIQAKKYKIGTYEIDKMSISCFDDKRYVLDDGIHTVAYFYKGCNHWKILSSLKGIMITKKYCDNGSILWSLNGIIIIEKYYDHWKILWSLKDIVIIEKHCDYWRVLQSLKNTVIIEGYYNHWKIFWSLTNIVIKKFLVIEQIK